MRVDGCVHHGWRQPLRCRSITGLPWRTRLAVVVSIAAIAGCGQQSDPSQANASGLSLETGTAPGVAPPSSGSGSEDADHDATPGIRRSSGTTGSAQPGSGNDELPTGGRPRDLTQLASGPPMPSTAGRLSHASTPPRAANEREAGTGDDAAFDQIYASLDVLERTLATLLATARHETGAPQLHIDATLLEGARERACTMASGATPLLAEDNTENIGLVVELEPDAAARAMHEWWMQSPEARDIRLAPTFNRYGVGACTSGERVYYSERFGS
jgi:uncharacterized protein YkwD